MACVGRRGHHYATTGEIIDGRPDFHEHGFGRTVAKSYPPYVFSVRNGALVHRVLRVELDWWIIGNGGHTLHRLVSPLSVAITPCGQHYHLTGVRCRTCRIPASDAILCEACQGTGRNFGRHGKTTEAGISRQVAKVRLGCAVVGY